MLRRATAHRAWPGWLKPPDGCHLARSADLRSENRESLSSRSLSPYDRLAGHGVDRELIPSPLLCRGLRPQILGVPRPSFDRLRMRLCKRRGARRRKRIRIITVIEIK